MWKTLDARLDRRDWGIELGKRITSSLAICFRRKSRSAGYEPLPSGEVDGTSPSLEMTPSRGTSISSLTGSAPPASTSPSSVPPNKHLRRPRYTQRLPFRRIFTRNVTVTLLCHSLLGFHIGTFNSLWFVFLSTPVYDPGSSHEPSSSSSSTSGRPQHLPFVFTGGLGLPPARVGAAMSILGVLGISLQLLVYPAVSARLGTVRCLRLFLLCFPVTYFVVPYLSLVPSVTPPPGPKSGVAVWLAIAAVLCCQVVGRTFALPNSVSASSFLSFCSFSFPPKVPILLSYTTRDLW